MAIKTTGKYKGKSNALGGGGRFAQGVDKMMSKGMSRDMASAIMAKQGMVKYGKAKMVSMAKKGKNKKK